MRAFNFQRDDDEDIDAFRRRVLEELADGKVLMPTNIEQAVTDAISDDIRELHIIREPSTEPWDVEVRRPWLN